MLVEAKCAILMTSYPVHKVGLNFTLDLACRDYPARGLKMEV